ncbi:MAG: LysR family transcriptional regulator [Gammaproteobacteria bacterium]
MSLLSPQLEAFVAITQYKTVHGAAAELHVTQTAVTQRIRTLENKLGTTLFIRTRRGMMLTPEGEALLRYCQASSELEGEALAIIQGAAKETTIRFCITGPTSIMRSRIVRQCFPIMKQFPNLLIHFDINDLETRVRSLRAGESQLAVVQRDDVAPEMECKLLKPEHYVLVCTSAWKQRSLQEIVKMERIIDYDPVDQVTVNYLKHFDLYELAQHDRHFVNRTDLLAMMLVGGLGYGVLALEFSKPYIERDELIVLNDNKIYENNMALAWYDRPEPPKYFSALIDAIN